MCAAARGDSETCRPGVVQSGPKASGSWKVLLNDLYEDMLGWIRK